MGPRFLVRAAGLEMHPIDQADRRGYLKDRAASASATSPSAAPRSARSTSRSPTTRSSRSRSASPTSTTTRSSGPGGSSAAAVRVAGAGDRAAGPAGAPPPARPGARLSDTLSRSWPNPIAGDDRRRPTVARGFVIRTDGAARGNPGPASLGAVLIDLDAPDAATTARRPTPRSPSTSASRRTTWPSTRASCGRSSWPPSSGAREVHLLLDSKLIVEQLAGRWRVKDAKLIPLWTAGRRTLAGFERWSAAHVPRALNSVADALANEAIDRVAGRRAGVGRCAGPATDGLVRTGRAAGAV